MTCPHMTTLPRKAAPILGQILRIYAIMVVYSRRLGLVDGKAGLKKGEFLPVRSPRFCTETTANSNRAAERYHDISPEELVRRRDPRRWDLEPEDTVRPSGSLS